MLFIIAFQAIQDTLICPLHNCWRANLHVRTDFSWHMLQNCSRAHTHSAVSPIHFSSLSGEVISLCSMKDKVGENVIFSFKHLFSANRAWRKERSWSAYIWTVNACAGSKLMGYFCGKEKHEKRILKCSTNMSCSFTAWASDWSSSIL